MTQYTPFITKPTPVPLNSRLIDLQGFQREHDEGFHSDVEYTSKPGQLEHIAHHFYKITRRLAQHLKAKRSNIDLTLSNRDLETRTIPDAFCFSLKLANHFDLVLESVLLARYPYFKGDVELRELQNAVLRDPATHESVLLDFAEYGGLLSDIAEKHFHGEPNTELLKRAKEESCPELLIASLRLASIHNLDLATAYLERMRVVEKHRIL